MVTQEEMHSTRGRARLLHEMLTGDLVRDGWRNEGVKEALDLCFACKACKTECPVNVDMATFKGRVPVALLRGPHAPAVGLRDRTLSLLARYGSVAPSLANWSTRAFAPLAKAAIGVAPERQLPELAPVSFKAWFGRRKKTHMKTPTGATHRVVLMG